MGALRQLAGQTAIYGVSSILGRLFNYLLVPIHTYNFINEQYGEVANMYAFAAILLVFLTYGLETAFFRFHNSSGKDPVVFSTSFISIFFSTIVLVALVILNRGFFAFWLNVPNNPHFVTWFAVIVGMDAIVAIPYARLRALNKARNFAVIKLINIGLNVGLNLFFIYAVPWLSLHGPGWVKSMVSLFYHGELIIDYIFIANIIASFIQLLIFLPGILKQKLRFDTVQWKRMMVYALPLLLLSLAGTINQTIDRLLLTWLLPADISMAQVGIYTACFKIPIIMYFFLQAFRYAAEPFFFSNASLDNARKTFPEVMNAFVILSALIFLGTMLFLDDIFVYFVDSGYREGKTIVPVVIFAFIFQGVGFNLSMWYKLTNRTIYGAWLAIIGTAVIIAVNALGIPQFGYMASAWAFLLANLVIMVLSWMLGQRHFPVPYKQWRILLYLAIPLVTWWLVEQLPIPNLAVRLVFRGVVFLAAALSLIRMEGWKLKSLF
ncbi:MAG: oligosaccharide flippase family protein [Bacteroidales bacterium]